MYATLEQSVLVEGADDASKAAATRLPRRGAGRLAAAAAAGTLALVASTALWRRGFGLRGHVAGAVGLSGVEASTEQCQRYFQTLLDLRRQVAFYRDDDSSGTAQALDFDGSAAEATKLLHDPRTTVVEVGECEKDPSKRSVVWFYPDVTGDDHAFLIADGECQRLASFADVDCAVIYRLSSVERIQAALERYHADGTIVHAVLGGHGTDSLQGSGFLVLSEHGGPDDESGRMTAFSPNVISMLQVLQAKLAPAPTIFMDSCFAGVNDVALTVSKAIPEAWVFGGVVSLTSRIVVKTAPFSGGDDGPVRLTAETSWDKVLDVAGTAKRGPRQGPAFQGGLVIPSQNANDLYYYGERIVGFHRGENRGSVTQWAFPSQNKKVVRAGCTVETLGEVWAARMENHGSAAEWIAFSQAMPQGVKGRVKYVDVDSRVPTSGAAHIGFDLPWSEETKGCGASLGTAVVPPVSFANLTVLDCDA